MKILLEIFISFFKTGLFTFGGGYAMLPLLKNEIVEKRKWVTEDELVDYFSIGQCTPGIIAINVSTCCGYKQKGVIGAATATFAMVLPSLIVILLVASILKNYIHLPVVESAFVGIRVGVTALLINMVWEMGKKVLKKEKGVLISLAIFLFALALLFLGNVSAVWVVVFAISSGLISVFVPRRSK